MLYSEKIKEPVGQFNSASKNKDFVNSQIRPEDLIGIVAPSDSVNIDLKPKFENGLKFIKDFGFKIKLGKYIYCNLDGSQRDATEKAEDINKMFADKNIRAIICAQGGENSNSILPYIDYGIIKNNPKPFIGISDITCILNGIYKKTGIITYHGNDIIWGFGRNPTDYDINEFKEKIIQGKFENLNKNSDWKILKKGKSEGILIGGNLSCLLNLVGTEYFPNFKNAILFIEDYKPSRTRFDSMINHLKQLGIFEEINGFILGHVDGLNEESSGIVLNILEKYNFPIIKIEEFGHNTPNTIIPLGMNVRIDTKKEEITYLKC